MGRRLPPGEIELYQRCDEVLHYLWDPIGGAGARRAADEYHAYLPRVFSLVRAKKKQELVEYLMMVEVDGMGLRPRPEAARQAAQIMMDYRAELEDRGAP